MVPDTLFWVPEMMDTPPIQSSYVFIISTNRVKSGGAYFLRNYNVWSISDGIDTWRTQKRTL